jgi:hypothetical protein
VTRWEGPIQSLGIDRRWGLPEPMRPGLGAYKSCVAFHGVRLRPVSGTAFAEVSAEQPRQPYQMTPWLGGDGGTVFCEPAPTGSRLVGFRCSTAGIIRGIQPVFRGAGGLLEGAHFGGNGDEAPPAIAKAGYAVGGIWVKAGGRVHGMRVVFMRDRQGRLDPKDFYHSEWIGERGGDEETLLGGTGQPVLGIHGAVGQDLESLGLMLARTPQSGQPGGSGDEFRLTHHHPLWANVGHYHLWVNSAPGSSWPWINRDFQFCDEFLYAHAPSKLAFEVPGDARSFSAVGYCVNSKDVSFQVIADGAKIFVSPKAGVVPIKADLPQGAKTLDLVIDDLGNNNRDWSSWLAPRFHRCTAAQIEQLDGPDEQATKLTELQRLKEQGGTGKTAVNRVPQESLAPLRMSREELCDEFLFAHAPSQIVYALPEGAKEFSAIGYCAKSDSVKFRVYADGDLLFQSCRAGIVPVRVPLPKGAKRLELCVDALDDSGSDHSIWCYPRLHW